MAADPVDPAAIDSAVAQAYSSASARHSRGRTAEVHPGARRRRPEPLRVVRDDARWSHRRDRRRRAPVPDRVHFEGVHVGIGARGAGPSCRACQARRQPHRGSVRFGAGSRTAQRQAELADGQRGRDGGDQLRDPPRTPLDRWRKILDAQSAFARRPLSISEEINASEQQTNAHNKAIAWLLYSAGTLFCDPMEACTVYTQQCSTMLNTADLATMGATLAAGGVNPHTGVRVMADSNVRYVLAEMVMEGMYTQSGDWAYTVGVPAKSGVGGGLLAVVPGRLAGGRLSRRNSNSAGNSVQGGLARRRRRREPAEVGPVRHPI